MKPTQTDRPRHARADDRLLSFEEIVERLPIPEASVRWKKHKGDLPFIFKIGRRLVAWESDLLDWIEKQATSATVRPGSSDTALPARPAGPVRVPQRTPRTRRPPTPSAARDVE